MAGIYTAFGYAPVMKSGYEFVMSEKAQLEDHLGEWIAVVGDGITASGDNIKDVYKKSRAKHPMKLHSL